MANSVERADRCVLGAKKRQNKISKKKIKINYKKKKKKKKTKKKYKI